MAWLAFLTPHGLSAAQPSRQPVIKIRGSILQGSCASRGAGGMREFAAFTVIHQLQKWLKDVGTEHESEQTAGSPLSMRVLGVGRDNEFFNSLELAMSASSESGMFLVGVRLAASPASAFGTQKLTVLGFCHLQQLIFLNRVFDKLVFLCVGI